jgi:hypothetical protein
MKPLLVRFQYSKMFKIVTTLWVARQRYRGSTPGGVNTFFLLHSVQIGSAAYPASYRMGKVVVLPRGKSGLSVKLATHLNLVPRPRMSGVIPPISNTSLWPDIYL